MAQKANLIVDQGSDFSTTLDVTDDEGNSIDLSTYTGRGQIKKHFTSLTKKDFTIQLSESGRVTISLSANTTDSMEPGRYVYDVELVSSASAVMRVVEGTLTITPSVTR